MNFLLKTFAFCFIQAVFNYYESTPERPKTLEMEAAFPAMFFVPVLKRSHFRMSIQETERFKNDAFQNVPQFPKVFLLISVFAYSMKANTHPKKVNVFEDVQKWMWP